ncbi:MAG: biotin transporter BioY [Oligoflexia bacterium]|nr:biotin transporter BioY [Oligoflexia bacterium]
MTQTSYALVPTLVVKSKNKLLAEALYVFAGFLLLSLLAQISFALPWTPVPITGQTFGVTLVALSWGRKRALGVISLYLFAGWAGLPVLASGKSALVYGPTFGYLCGMVLSSYAVGHLSDLGFTKTFLKSLVAAFTGSVFTFGCGLFVLSFFVPREALLVSGLLPFIPGDILKNTLAAVLSNKARKFVL